MTLVTSCRTSRRSVRGSRRCATEYEPPVTPLDHGLPARQQSRGAPSMTMTHALIAASAGAALEPGTIERRDLRDDDVQIDIKFAGICHTDIHQVREEWGQAIFPMVPGHEIAGIVSAVGPGVTRYQVGDRVGVGCMVDSCGECEFCKDGEEQYCTKGAVMTYNGTRLRRRADHGRLQPAGRRLRAVHPRHPRGHRARRRRAAAVRRHHDLLARCKRWGAGPGKKVAVIGMGGLGHMARQDRRRHGRRGHRPVPHARQAGGRQALRRDAPLRHQDDGDLHGDASRQLRPDHQHGQRRPADGRLHGAAAPARRPGQRRPARPSRTRSRPSPSSAAAGPSPARTSAASPRPRRCSTSAPSTTSGPRSRRSAPTRSTRPTSASSSCDVRYRFVIDTATISA